MKCSGRICLALLFALDLAWASVAAAQAPEKILFLNKSNTFPVRFVVEGTGRTWFGWGWSEGATAIDLYPAARTVNSTISEPVLKVSGQVSTMQLKAADSQFPEIGIGPGREFWLLTTPGASASPTEPWERLLDAVEAAYRQRTELRPGEPIGTLGTCEILSFPVETGTVEWRSTWTLTNASPKASGENSYKQVNGAGPSGDVEIRRFMRWVRQTTDPGSCGDTADLRLFPVEKIVTGQPGHFLELTGAKTQSLSFAEIAPEKWTPGSRIRTERLSRPPSVAAVVESAKGDIDLCTREELKDLCKIDQILRQRLYVWNPQNSLPEEIRKPLEEACSKALGEPCANKAEWQGSVAGVFVRSYTGPVRLSKEPPIESRSVNGQVQWSTAWDGEGLEAPIRLLNDSVVQVALKTSAEGWSRDNIVATILLASIGLLLLYWSRHSPKWNKLIERVEERSFSPEDATPAPAAPAAPPVVPPPTPGLTPQPPSMDLRKVITEILKAELLQSFEIRGHREIEQADEHQKKLAQTFEGYKTELSELQDQILELLQRVETSGHRGIEQADEYQKILAMAFEAKRTEIEQVGQGIANQLRTVDESVRRRLVELAAEDLKGISQDLMAKWPRKASELVSRDLNESVQRAVEQETLTKWSFFMGFFQDLGSLLRSPERVTQLLALATLAERSPAIAQRLEDLSLILPAEGTLATLNPDDPQLRLTARRDGHEYAAQRYSPLVEEILGLGAPEQGQIFSSLEAASRLGYWAQALLGTLERVFKLELSDQWLPAPAHSEFDQARWRAWTYVAIDAPVFRNLVRMVKEGGVGRPGTGSPPALLGYGEGSFLEGAGLIVQNRSLPERLRNFFAPLNQIGRLGEVCLALQYLVEAFPAEQLQPKDRSDLEKELKGALSDRNLPPSFHSLIKEVAVGFGLRYLPVPYHKARLDDPQYKFIGREVTAISLEQRIGHGLSGLDRVVVVRLQRPFLEDDDEHGIYYAGHAHVANV